MNSIANSTLPQGEELSFVKKREETNLKIKKENLSVIWTSWSIFPCFHAIDDGQDKD